jgi:hypothetical protein
MRPQSAIVETSDFGQGVEAAAMSVAGEILKLLQFPKDSEIGVGAENAFQLGQIGDLVTAEMLAQGRWKEVGRIMLEFTLLAWDSENYNIINYKPSHKCLPSSCGERVGPPQDRS